MNYTCSLLNLSDTNKLAKLIAHAIKPNMTIVLNGNLGAGKTTLTRDILHSLGISGSIKSPTFTLVEPYELPSYTVYHFDLYRFGDPEEWFDSGFDEYFLGRFICFIEWAEKAHGLIPQVDWQIDIVLDINNNRTLKISALTAEGIECLMRLINNAEI